MKKILKKAYHKLITGRIENRKYQKWIAEQIPDEEERKRQSEKKFDYMPLFSIVVPLYRTPEKYLEELIESVKVQTYGKWELILSDGSGDHSPLQDFFVKTKEDSRIHILEHNSQLDISENTNCGLRKAHGDYIVFADHDDVLPPYALYECAEVVNNHPEIELIYSDEDKINMDSTRYFQPHFKPDFNLTMLRSVNYFCHLVVVKKSLQEKVGLLNAEYNGAQDYDFVLRCSEQAKEICHIPKILYHWRAHPGSTAGDGNSKEYAIEAGRKALAAHYKRCGILADVSAGELFGTYRAEIDLKDKPLVSVITSNQFEAKKILDISGYDHYEVIDKKSFDIESSVCKGEYLLFLSENICGADAGWLKAMMGYASLEQIGVVGAQIFRKSKRLHAGISYQGSDVCVIGQGSDRDDVGYFGRYIYSQEYPAVETLCMVVRRLEYEKAGGVDNNLSNVPQSVDFCMKIRENGYKIVYCAEAHIEVS